MCTGCLNDEDENIKVRGLSEDLFVVVTQVFSYPRRNVKAWWEVIVDKVSHTVAARRIGQIVTCCKVKADLLWPSTMCFSHRSTLRIFLPP